MGQSLINLTALTLYKTANIHFFFYPYGWIFEKMLCKNIIRLGVIWFNKEID